MKRIVGDDENRVELIPNGFDIIKVARRLYHLLDGYSAWCSFINHHHLARALHDEGVKEVLVTVIADLSMVDRDAFWVVMDNRRWVYPYNSKGERCHFKDIPKSVADLKDDPFRSLAGELRRVGGFAKDTTPFSEFL